MDPQSDAFAIPAGAEEPAPVRPPVDEERRSKSPGIERNFYDVPQADFKMPHGASMEAYPPTPAPAPEVGFGTVPRSQYGGNQPPVTDPRVGRGWSIGASQWQAPPGFGAESPVPGREKEYEAMKLELASEMDSLADDVAGTVAPPVENRAAQPEWQAPPGFGAESAEPGREKEYEAMKAGLAGPAESAGDDAAGTEAAPTAEDRAADEENAAPAATSEEYEAMKEHAEKLFKLSPEKAAEAAEGTGAGTTLEVAQAAEGDEADPQPVTAQDVVKDAAEKARQLWPEGAPKGTFAASSKDLVEEAETDKKDVKEDVKAATKAEDVNMKDVNMEVEVEDATADVKADVKAEDVKADAKAEDVKADAKAEDVKADGKAEDVKADVKAEDVKADVKAEDVKADVKAEDVKADVRADKKTKKGKKKSRKDSPPPKMAAAEDSEAPPESTSPTEEEPSARDGAGARSTGVYAHRGVAPRAIGQIPVAVRRPGHELHLLRHLHDVHHLRYL